MKSISSFRPATLVLVALTALTGWCGAEEPAKADFFDITGKSPAEVAATIPERGLKDNMAVLLGGFVRLPMSDAHRKEFMAGLRASLETDPAKKGLTRLCLVNLLEEDGAFADALAVERAVPRPGGAAGSARYVALLWKSGKADEAAKLADAMRITGNDLDAWLSLVRIDMTKHQPTEAMRLLEFLEKRPNFPARLRYELAIQHLEIARRAGVAADLLAGSAPPVLRAVWHWALGHKQEALDAALAAGPEPSVSDIQMLGLSLGPDSPAGAYAKAALAKADTARDDRRALLAVFKMPLERLAAWLEMPAGHGETTDQLGLLPGPDELKKIPDAKRRLMEILKTHPGNANLNLLAASPVFSSPDEAKPLLLEAVKAVRETPVAGDADTSDPAMKALQILVKTSDPKELDRVLKESPAFAKLSPESQLRYLMTADLDTEVVKTMARCHFDRPAAGNAGLDLLSYFNRRAYGRQIPAEVVATLLDRLPELVLGCSSDRHTLYNLQETRRSLEFLSQQPVPEPVVADAINRLVNAAGQLDPAMRESLILLLPASVRSLPGLNFQPSAKANSAALLPETPDIFGFLSIFSPSDITAIDLNQYSPRRPLMLLPGASRDPGASILFTISPWAQNYRGTFYLRGTNPAVAAKLRTLLAGDPPRTLIYDLFVATNALTQVS